MDERLLFNEALTSLMEYATINGGQLSKEDVKKYFKDILRDETKYQSIYAYLAENKVKLTDIDISEFNSIDNSHFTADSNLNSSSDMPADTLSTSFPSSKWEAEESAILQMYQEDLKNKKPLSQEEQLYHLQQLKNGDMTARQILTEHFLQSVLDIVPQYQNQGVSTADLIQEGNLGILLALSDYEILEYENSDWLDSKNIDCVNSVNLAIEQAIHKAMQQSIEEQNGSTRIDEHLVSRINALNDATTELAKGFDREPTLEELSNYLALSEEEIRTLMKISMDALTLNETAST